MTIFFDFFPIFSLTAARTRAIFPQDMPYKKSDFTPPVDDDRLLLHCCCAPCACAIVELLLQFEITPTLFYFNPNIFPEAEYLKRKSECARFADLNGLTQVDADYDHADWRAKIAGLEHEPERGARCQRCFDIRLLKTAEHAQAHGFKMFATTLASSRWKDITQIDKAGFAAEQLTGVKFWAQNWRKHGLQQRRNDLIKQHNFYNQIYCGCEFFNFSKA